MGNKINDTTLYPNTVPTMSDHVPGTDVSNTGNDPNGEHVTFLWSAVKTLYASFAETLTNKTINTASNTITIVEADISDLGAYSTATGVENNATADQTGAEIKAAYEGEANAFTDTKNTKLSGVEALADVTDAVNVGAVANGQKHLFIPANAMTPRTTGGAASGTIETTTNKVMVDTYDFDSAADEHVQFSMQMPKSWDEGTLVAQVIWSHPTTTTNFGVAWFIQALAFGDSDALDTAFGTAIEIDDTGGTTDDVFISPESAAITVGGTPGSEEWVTFQVYRDVSDGFDDMAVDARLHGVKIHYTTDALTDA